MMSEPRWTVILVTILIECDYITKISTCVCHLHTASLTFLYICIWIEWASIF